LGPSRASLFAEYFSSKELKGEKGHLIESIRNIFMEVGKMSSLPNRSLNRIVTSLKRFQPILVSARSRDVNESDTVVIVNDLLHEVFGYDKYTEITSEKLIRGTFCDLAIKLDDALKLIIEVKAIGLDLKENHVTQAGNYAANQGVEWVFLTNGIIWRAYKVTFAKPICYELVVEINLCELNPRSMAHIDMISLFAKEGWQKGLLGDYHSQMQALNRFSIAAIILSDSFKETVRRELRRISPGVKIDIQDIDKVLRNEVIKREVLEGDKADAARKNIQKVAARARRAGKTSGSSKDVKFLKPSEAAEGNMPKQPNI
jgi:hypothetical protein